MTFVRILSIIGWSATAALICYYVSGRPYPKPVPRWFFVALAVGAAFVRFYEAF